MAGLELRGDARRGIASYSPAAKLALWIGVVAVLALVVQSAAWLLGLDFNILSQGKAGRAVLLVLALGSLLALMATDRRSLAEYGLEISDRWPRQWFGAVLAGLVTYAAYCLLAAGAGAFQMQGPVGAYRWASAALGALTAFPVAVSQQIIFSGYLLALVGGRHGRVWSVVAVSLLFAALSQMSEPLALLSGVHYPLVVGMFLIASLLSVLRLYYGSILVPAGLLAGWIFVRRVVGKTHLLGMADPEPARWLAPSGDPRQAPVMWLALALAIAGFTLLLRRRGEPAARAAADVATSFKRYFPLSSPAILAPLDLWISRLWDARFQVGWRYLPRLAATLVLSSVNTILSLPERVLLPWCLRRRVPDPVFVLGMHRSGTTHLHNLLALDGQFVCPRTYQIMNPVGCLFSGWLVTPLLGAFLPPQRPMDGVRFHVFSPQEEEFALANSTRLSPYWSMTFPRRGRAYDRYILPEGFSAREVRAWKKHYLLFLKKLVFWSGRRPVLKNPFNTGRVALLSELFPQAKFIHIHRHPYAVYRSNMHLAQEGHCLAQLQDPEEQSSYSVRFLDNYRAMETAYYDQVDQLPSGQAAEVCFETLERDPIGEIQRLYRHLGLRYDRQFHERLKRYLASVADYQKNRFDPLPEDVQRQIHRKLRPLFDRWGYDADAQGRAAGSGQAA